MRQGGGEGEIPLERLIRVVHNRDRGERWLARHRGQRPYFACVLGFTETALLPGISAAGASPADRRHTALADGEFLIAGPQGRPRYPLPPLQAGVSPAAISRAIVTALDIPTCLIDAGLPEPLPVPAIALAGAQVARCLSTGRALDRAAVDQLIAAGLAWGDRLGRQIGPRGYVIVGECVVGGTTTALGVLRALGYAADGLVNSSHPQCNHGQKAALVAQGFAQAAFKTMPVPPREAIAALGDPMQAAAAAIALAASRHGGVLLAGGTQMLAVYALARAIAQRERHPWHPDAIAIGTTRWVIDDPSASAQRLAALLTEGDDAPCLLASELNFSGAALPALRAYEAGFVKEGVGAGGCAIAASLYGGWDSNSILAAIETLLRIDGPRLNERSGRTSESDRAP
jgi:uncharacterized protein (TIGR00303 family)